MKASYTQEQREQAAGQIIKDMEPILGPAPDGALPGIAETLSDQDIAYALGEVQREKHGKHWDKS